MKSFMDRPIEAQIERSHMKHKRKYIYTSLENVPDTDWYWSVNEILTFQELWEADISLRDMAAYLKRTEMSVLLLSLDRMAKGKIAPRDGWSIW
jgi:hypothetical protein